VNREFKYQGLSPRQVKLDQLCDRLSIKKWSLEFTPTWLTLWPKHFLSKPVNPDILISVQQMDESNNPNGLLDERLPLLKAFKWDQRMGVLLTCADW